MIIDINQICSPSIKEVIINYKSMHFKPTELTAGQLEVNKCRATFDYEKIKGSTGFDKEALIGQITIKSIQLMVKGKLIKVESYNS